jgi:Fe-S oxidoreductase
MRRSIWKEHSPVGDIRLFDRGEVSEVDDKFWYCTTCRACLEVCPVYGGAFEIAAKKRVLSIEEGTDVPKLITQTLAKLSKYDNPWESSRNKRGAWAEGMDLVDLTKTDTPADICYFVGCTTSLEPTAQGEAQAFAKILQSAGVNFGILGKKEPCCGDVAKRMGELGLFAEQRENTLNAFDEYSITDVVTFSPHCFNALNNEYPEAPFRARHYTMVLRELIASGKLRFKEVDRATVTYHDPCYLSRYNRIVDEPREIIRSIPGVTLVEMSHFGADSLCCGGGGGRMWQDLEGVGKMSEVRIREAEATGAQIVVTACPLCRIMLEDARKSAGLNQKLQIMDLNELVLQALKEGDE